MKLPVIKHSHYLFFYLQLLRNLFNFYKNGINSKDIFLFTYSAELRPYFSVMGPKPRIVIHNAFEFNRLKRKAVTNVKKERTVRKLLRSKNTRAALRRLFEEIR